MSTRPELHYEIAGNSSGPWIVLLHGFMGSSEDWRELLRCLRGTYRVVLIDLPGHGASLPGPVQTAACTMTSTAQSVLQVLDDCRIDQCALLGYSMGGRLALHLALAHPERFRAVALESASPGLRTEDERRRRRDHDDMLAARLEDEELALFLDSWYRQPLFATLRAHPSFEGLLERRLRNESAELAAALRALSTGRQESLWSELADCRLPILFVAGDKDHKYRSIAQAMAQSCPAGRLQIISRAGHNIHCESTRVFAEQVEDFFSEHMGVSS